jgi:hypothetical protein
MRKSSGLKKIYFFFSSAFLFLLHLPFVFAKNKPTVETNPMPLKVESNVPADSVSRLTVVDNASNANSFSFLYDSLRLNLMGLSQQAFNYAMQGFNYLVKTGKLANDRVISIVDFSLPSSKKRLFIIDLDKAKVLFNTYVAHGANSGTLNATRFSNTPESNQSSLGFYETSNTYIGGHGYSLRLDGLEPGFNDNANSRAIVMHAAPYVDESLIRTQGYIGRSWGCPAVPENLHKPIIDKIKNGTCLFIFSPDKNYLSHSRVLHPAG